MSNMIVYFEEFFFRGVLDVIVCSILIYLIATFSFRVEVARWISGLELQYPTSMVVLSYTPASD